MSNQALPVLLREVGAGGAFPTTTCDINLSEKCASTNHYCFNENAIEKRFVINDKQRCGLAVCFECMNTCLKPELLEKAREQNFCAHCTVEQHSATLQSNEVEHTKEQLKTIVKNVRSLCIDDEIYFNALQETPRAAQGKIQSKGWFRPKGEKVEYKGLADIASEYWKKFDNSLYFDLPKSNHSAMKKRLAQCIYDKMTAKADKRKAFNEHMAPEIWDFIKDYNIDRIVYFYEQSQVLEYAVEQWSDAKEKD